MASKRDKIADAVYSLTSDLDALARMKANEGDVYAVHWLVGEIIKLNQLPRKLKMRLGEDMGAL